MEGIVDLPSEASGASASANEASAVGGASGSGASPEKTKDKEKDGQGERQGAGVGTRGADVSGSPNGSGRKKEVDLVSPFLSLLWVSCLLSWSSIFEAQ